MTAGTVVSLVAAAGLKLPEDLLVVLDENPELKGIGYTGHTWPDGERNHAVPGRIRG